MKHISLAFSLVFLAACSSDSNDAPRGTPTPVATPTPTPTVTAPPSATPTAAPTSTPSNTPVPSTTPSAAPSPTPSPSPEPSPVSSDPDGDGVILSGDNCPDIFNPDQTDTDFDGLGNLCDSDIDGDGINNTGDNCPAVRNSNQADLSGFSPNGLGDACEDSDGDGILDGAPDPIVKAFPAGSDNCPVNYNPGQEDFDNDGLGDACDPDIDQDGLVNLNDTCPFTNDPSNNPDACFNDADSDGIFNAVDNCRNLPNPGQEDNVDGDGVGDHCDFSGDTDPIPHLIDNCPNATNRTQIDSDGDGLGDACDPDIDDDGVANATDNCPFVANADQALSTNPDGRGLACELDFDGDGFGDLSDNCAAQINPTQLDSDGNGIGDACDDRDIDAITDINDNCPGASNPNQRDTDNDGRGDACDLDQDNDGVGNADDLCPLVFNPGQEDNDADGNGDVCDNDIDGDEIENADDVCPSVADPEQLDTDQDGLGDLCDAFPTVAGCGVEPLRTVEGVPQMLALTKINATGSPLAEHFRSPDAADFFGSDYEDFNRLVLDPIIGNTCISPLCGVSNFDAVLDADFSNFASMSSIVGIGPDYSLAFAAPVFGLPLPAGTRVGFVVEDALAGTLGVEVGLNEVMTIRTFRNATLRETFAGDTNGNDILELEVLGLTEVGNDTVPILISAVTTRSFDTFELSFSETLQVGLIGDDVRVYASCLGLVPGTPAPSPSP